MSLIAALSVPSGTNGSVPVATAPGRSRARVGVDPGVKTLAVVADEHGNQLTVWEGVKALQQAQVRLKLADQPYARTKRDSKGRRKAARRLGRMHGRVAAVRKALLHSISSQLAKTSAVVVIEDLHAAGMLRNRKLARHISDAGFGELRRQLEYRGAWYGTEVVVADRVYECGDRGLVIDRDLNAAISLARYTPPAEPAGTTKSPPLHAAA